MSSCLPTVLEARLPITDSRSPTPSNQTAILSTRSSAPGPSVRPRRYTHRPIAIRSRVKVTNPIHPLYGREVEYVDSYRRNGLLEVFIRRPDDADVQGLPAWATDVNGPECFNEKPESHVLFRAELLLKTVEKLGLLTDRLSLESEGRHDSCPSAAGPTAAARRAASLASPGDSDGHLDPPHTRSDKCSDGGQP